MSVACSAALSDWNRSARRAIVRSRRLCRVRRFRLPAANESIIASLIKRDRLH